MQSFKMKFPSGYQVLNIYNDNIDLNVILQDSRVFFGTAFTILNVQYLMDKENDIYFWSTDMFILKDLKKTTIQNAIMKIIEDGYLEHVFSQIGYVNTIYGKDKKYDDVACDLI